MARGVWELRESLALKDGKGQRGGIADFYDFDRVSHHADRIVRWKAGGWPFACVCDCMCCMSDMRRMQRDGRWSRPYRTLSSGVVLDGKKCVSSLSKLSMAVVELLLASVYCFSLETTVVEEIPCLDTLRAIVVCVRVVKNLDRRKRGFVSNLLMKNSECFCFLFQLRRLHQCDTARFGKPRSDVNKLCITYARTVEGRGRGFLAAVVYNPDPIPPTFLFW